METAAGARAKAWGALAVGFHGGGAADVAPRARAAAEALRDAGSAAADAFLRWAESGGLDDEPRVRQDFHDLFLVPSPKYVRPYESVWADDPVAVGDRPARAQHFGPSTRQVRSFYAAVGLDVDPAYTELPDYVGLELACMEYLAAREEEPLQGAAPPSGVDPAERRRHFVQHHLGRWLPRLCDEVRRRAGTRWHATMADAAVALLRDEPGSVSA